MIVPRGLGQTIPSPGSFGDIQSFLDATAGANGLAVCRTGTYTGCPDPAGFASLMTQAEQAWFNFHPAPGSQGSVTSPITGMTTVAPPPPAPTPAQSSLAPVNPTPIRVLQGATQITNRPDTQQPSAGTATVTPAGQVVGQSSSSSLQESIVPLASSSTFDLSMIPWWVWVLGAGGLLFAFGGKR